MKYLLTIYADENIWKNFSSEHSEKWIERYVNLVEDLKNEDVFLAAERLLPIESATTVQMRQGETLISDGPFAETKEQLGGFFLVDCENLDKAIEVAKRIPSSEIGRIEVRPLWYQET